MSATQVVTHLRDVLSEQYKLAHRFWTDPKFHGPMMTIWVATLGGSLHSSVTTFFYLEVGATATDIGTLGVISTSQSLILSPLYGWLLDKHSAYSAMVLSCLVCATGCLVRGLAADVHTLKIGAFILGLGGANLWTTVLAYCSKYTERENRSLIVSGFIFQVTALKLVGKSMYPPFSFLLQALWPNQTTVRYYRATMAICTVFCFVGFLELLRTGKAVREATLVLPSDRASEDPDSAKSTKSAPKEKQSVAGFVLMAMILVLQAFCVTVGDVLWPLFLHDRYSWGPTYYSYMLFLSGVLSALGIASVSSFERRLGGSRFLIWTCSFAAVTCLIAFSIPNVVVHIVFSIGFVSAMACADPAIKTLATLFLPATLQGRSFGVLATISGLGSILGHWAGTRLYRMPAYQGSAVWAFSYSEGGLPYLAVTLALTLAVMILLWVSAHYDNEKDKQTPPSSPPSSPCIKQNPNFRRML
ncbi:hypothetical protein CYMTET_53935 [Cymbomonas tetramitiformis]|uniref:Major facilitator superfamily (MFS) profile domain-containing protein n=1 Tax=Cymbomonas tetramitiformis TaxID=36881 RepID=A0AAE0BG93_9CHLO|nr:hypothetical protein CYMTET_53935 [Cymbomonas tetramitiformis]